jgi:hypothetical protein
MPNVIEQHLCLVPGIFIVRKLMVTNFSQISADL